MDKKFLDKVLDQIVNETTIDYDKERVNVPFLPSLPPFSLPLSSSLFIFSPTSFRFFEHCESVYGLNEEETRYVWNEYVQTIKDKIENNG